MTTKSRPRLFIAAVCLFVLAQAAGAQQLIIKGMYGMMAGTQPPPGLYVGAFGSVNWADELKTGGGDTIHGPKLTQEVFGPLIMWISPYKILGADYGATVGVPFANTRVEFPRLADATGSTGIAFSQLYVVPIQLGWHIKDPLPLSPGGADITVHYAFYAPTGQYTPGATDNTSLGMWSNEVSARLTAYFDKDRVWSGSAALFYDFNSKKQGQDWTTGNPFTFMGGIGPTYGAKDSLFSGWFGLVGYSQFQVTDTTGVDAPLLARLNKTRIYSAGPEFTTLQGALTLRYFWQFGGKFSTQGQGLYVQFAMPIGK
jgi:hypothetical protein